VKYTPRDTSNEFGAIARFKRPKIYHFLDHLPKNNYGKVLKTALRENLHSMNQ
jgi:acyl-CoA synthetase (AMP-forming)/AMP-acid ligase II